MEEKEGILGKDDGSDGERGRKEKIAGEKGQRKAIS